METMLERSPLGVHWSSVGNADQAPRDPALASDHSPRTLLEELQRQVNMITEANSNYKGIINWRLRARMALKLFNDTVKPRPEAHMDMILFEVFLKSIDLIPQQQVVQRHYLYYR